MAGTLAILRGAMKPNIWNVRVTNVIAGGEQAAVELTINSEVRSTNFDVNYIAKKRCSVHEQILLAHEV